MRRGTCGATRIFCTSEAGIRGRGGMGGLPHRPGPVGLRGGLTMASPGGALCVVFHEHYSTLPGEYNPSRGGSTGEGGGMFGESKGAGDGSTDGPDGTGWGRRTDPQISQITQIGDGARLGSKAEGFGVRREAKRTGAFGPGTRAEKAALRAALQTARGRSRGSLPAAGAFGPCPGGHKGRPYDRATPRPPRLRGTSSPNLLVAPWLW